jgi:hypothetical protein
VRQRDVRSDKSFAFDGGLDLISAPRKLRPGAAIGGFNYEVALGGGYRRVDGYERADGGPRPRPPSTSASPSPTGRTGSRSRTTC